MAGITYCINVTGGDGDDPFKADSKRGNLIRLINVFKGLLAGAKASSYTVDLHTAGTKASATATCAAVAVANTVTVNGTAMTATQQNARATVTLATAVAANTVTVQGEVITAVSGTATAGTQFDISGGNTTGAASLAAAINANPNLLNIVTATSAAAIVTIRAIVAGTGGNALTLVSSDGAKLACTGSGVLAGGAAIANNQFDFGGSNTQTATSLAYAINNSTTAGVSQVVTATSAAAVVTITCKYPGLIGNKVTLVSSDGATLAVTGSGVLASGLDTANYVLTF